MDASGCSMLVLHGAANVGILMKPEKMFWMNFWKIEFLPHTDFAPSFTLISINIKSPQYILGNLDTLPTRLLGTVYFRRIYKLCSMWACAPSTDRCTPDSRCCKYTIIQVHKYAKIQKQIHKFWISWDLAPTADRCSPDGGGGDLWLQVALQVQAALQVELEVQAAKAAIRCRVKCNNNVSAGT